MSFAPTFFNFLDVINDQVQTLGRVLDDSQSAPCPQSTTSKRKTGTELQKNNENNGWFEAGSTVLIPAVDLLEHENNYELNVSIPGITDKEDINLEYHKKTNQIIVSGEIPSAVTDENKDRVRVKELISGKFKRTITLPETPDVDIENIKAEYTSGVLRLNVPKLELVQPNEVKKIAISDCDFSRLRSIM